MIHLGSRSALFTDHYQLVMGQLYFREGLAERRAQFDYFFRENPDYGTHQAGFCIAAGLEPLLEWLDTTSFGEAETAALRELRTAAGEPLFDEAYLDWLVSSCDFSLLELTSIAEGRVIHPHLPVMSVVGPMAVAQIVETALLNHLNYATLIATKAARVRQSAQSSVVLEFGMRRGAGAAVDEGARAALIGGCNATSNVEASVVLGTDPKGTHAHSLVQAYLATGGGELEAFRAFARSYPDDCVLLVDTIDTLRSGMPNAITVFNELRAAGHEPVGVRLDSGDLAYLGVQAARQLDAAGFPDASIVLSGDLDELTIWQIRSQIFEEAIRVGLDPTAMLARLVYGVGTRLITSHGESALGGVFKLVGVENAEGEWEPAIKLSENPVKIPIPGAKSVWRLYDHAGVATVDLVAVPDEDPLGDDDIEAFHPFLDGVSRIIRRSDIARAEALRSDPRLQRDQGLAMSRQRALDDVAALDPGVRRLVNPHRYHVSLTKAMKERQRTVIAAVRSRA
ncbi:MAG: nicotinate phosphoribosyltransferase [Acidimicrobiales bacterium]